MEEIGIRELRQQASRYIKRVVAGESFVITDYGAPVAVLAPTMDAVRAESEAVIQSLVDAGLYRSVEDALADDTQQLVTQARQRVVGDAIVAGYRRHPQSDAEVAVARSAGVRAIDAEPW